MLDAETVCLDGWRIAGLGGVIGSSARPARREEGDFLHLLGEMLKASPDVMIMHQGPHGDEAEKQRGHAAIRQVLCHNPPPLTVCGHVHWQEASARLPATRKRAADGHVINVDSRVLVLTC